MKKIVVSVKNNLLAESITKILADSGVFNPFRVPVHRKNKDTAKQCEALQTELLLVANIAIIQEKLLRLSVLPTDAKKNCF